MMTLRHAARGLRAAAPLRRLALWTLVLAATLVVAPAGPARAEGGTSLDRTGELLREHVELVRAGGKVDADGETIVSHVVLPILYEEAGFRRLWPDTARVLPLLGMLRELEADGLNPADYHYDALLRLWPKVQQDPSPELAAHFDLLATDGFVLALYHLALGKVDPDRIEPDWNFNPREVRDQEALEFIRKAIDTGRIREAADVARPEGWMYAAGREALIEYRAIADRGGWETIPAGPSLKPGMRDPRVPALRRRLAVTGDYAGPTVVLEPAPPGDAAATASTAAPTASVESTLYDEPLAAAVRVFQARHLLTADGAIGPATLRELNVPVAARIDQIRLNMERGRWVLHEIGNGNLVVVDVAGYGVRYLEGDRVVWRSRAIVGKPFRQTPIFRAEIDHIVFNPTWTVPPGILEKDILPGMRRGENVLRRKGLKVYDRNNRPVDPATIDWGKYNGRNFPYFLRQDAGEDNALGRVKINFPNPHLVYLHDTPTRDLFDKDERTFSSGCIRVERPLELAEIVLADPAQWNRAAIDRVVAAAQTRTVTLKKKVPVLLIYWTVDRDEAGRIVFKRDVYDRDPKLLAALNERFTVGDRRPL